VPDGPEAPQALPAAAVVKPAAFAESPRLEEVEQVRPAEQDREAAAGVVRKGSARDEARAVPDGPE